MIHAAFRSPDRSLPLLPAIALMALALPLHCAEVAHAAPASPAETKTVHVKLTEWAVELTPRIVPSGSVVFEVDNAGTIPHAFEVEGGGFEKSIPQINPGKSGMLALQLAPGHYEAYCPVGKGSHEMLGMKTEFDVRAARTGTAGRPVARRAPAKQAAPTSERMAMNGMGEHPTDAAMHEDHEMHEMHAAPGMSASAPKLMRVAGGGPVIQILPGPFPFADSAMAVIAQRPADQMKDLSHKAETGPYSNNVAKISGDISLLAIERGATGDSVSGVAQFTAQDGGRWKLVLDRVQTKDIPFNPRFGGVIMGLYYHGATNVHTPLVPTIQSSLALWAIGHLYENDVLVTDDAMVHIMLLSRTRRPGDWALECWDCSERPIEELQLQVTPPPSGRPFDAPGGVLFVNWEKSSGALETLDARSGSTMGHAMESEHAPAR